jgi:hypothetical protein
VTKIDAPRKKAVLRILVFVIHLQLFLLLGLFLAPTATAITYAVSFQGHSYGIGTRLEANEGLIKDKG